MTPQYDLSRYSHIHERLAEFTELAGRLIVELGLEKTGGRGPKGEPASDRVIRDYVSRGVLSPTLRGQDSDERGFYGFRHLVEFLAARVFLNDGWPLEKIAERLRHAPTEELVLLIPGQPDHNDALALARSFRRPTDEIESRRRRGLGMSAQDDLRSLAGQRGLFPEQDPSVSASRRRAELPLLMRRITGTDRPPSIRRVVAIEFGDEMTLLIDQRRLQAMSLDEADLIGRAVTSALLDFPNLARGKETK